MWVGVEERKHVYCSAVTPKCPEEGSGVWNWLGREVKGRQQNRKMSTRTQKLWAVGLFGGDWWF